MPPLGGIAVRGEFPVHVDKHRAGKMAGEIIGSAIVLLEPVPHIEQTNTVTGLEACAELVHRDEREPGGRHTDIFTCRNRRPAGRVSVGWQPGQSCAVVCAAKRVLMTRRVCG